jgi:hypothetical protein
MTLLVYVKTVTEKSIEYIDAAAEEKAFALLH